MVHKHSVYDTDLHFTIDPVTRKISSQSGKVNLMQRDHNSERFTFDLPRTIEEHDMTLCNMVEVHYINTDSANKRNQSADVYPVLDLQISPDSDDVVCLSWLISENATMYGGQLSFLIRFACVSEETGEILYQWFTDIYTGISVLKGIYNTDLVTDEGSPDVLAVWKEDIYNMTSGLTAATKASAEAAKQSAMIAKAAEEIATSSASVAVKCAENAKESETIALEKAEETEQNALISQSYAVGGSGIRDGEDLDNSKYYSGVAENVTDVALEKLQEATNALREIERKLMNTEFTINVETGNLEYTNPGIIFVVNEETGNLEWEVAA